MNETRHRAREKGRLRGVNGKRHRARKKGRLRRMKSTGKKSFDTLIDGIITDR